MKLRDIALEIIFSFGLECYVVGDKLIVEQGYTMGPDEKNSDDCCDAARENGEMIIEKYPELEIDNYYCHRNKYAIVELKLKS